MKTIFLYISIFLLVITDDFKSDQLKHVRVKNAYKLKEESLHQLYKEKGADFLSSGIFIRVFKQEKKLELWAKNKQGVYILLKEYTICSASGSLGPKRQQGDEQVPEGFYHIDLFNPYSSFHLSMRINYPNSSDKLLSNAANPGGDIFIHGHCVSIGCLAMTDDKIRELYIAAVQARNSGQQKIPVHIFPFRMTKEKMTSYRQKYNHNLPLVNFWENLKTGYDLFEGTGKLSVISTDSKGKYKFS